MDRIKISAQKRELGSKSNLHILRKSGKVPAVLNGNGSGSLPLILDGNDLKKALSTPAGKNVLFDLEIEEIGSHTAMIENIQRDSLKDGVYLHVNLIRVNLDTKINVNIPVILVGQDMRVSDGGIVSHSIYEILVQSETKSIPENIKVDISKMTLGDHIMLKDITLPEGCTAITPLNQVLVSILHPRGLSPAPEAIVTEAAKHEEKVAAETPA